MRPYACAAFLLAAFSAGIAGAQVITEFTAGSPIDIVAGPDGNLWFTDFGDRKIGSMTTSGTVVYFGPLASGGQPWAITRGPDGNLWFTEKMPNQSQAPQIGRITPAGVITEFPLPCSQNCASGTAFAITAGSDGALWFAMPLGNGYIGRLTTSGAYSEYYVALGGSGSLTSNLGITSGPDSAIWFSENGLSRIGRMTTAGTVTNNFPLPAFCSDPEGIVSGPDGALWFTEGTGCGTGNGNRIGRISTSGTLTEYNVPTATSNPYGIAVGSDGALWFTENNAKKIGRITTSGSITEFPLPAASNKPASITAGPDGALWFTEPPNKIGRITTSGSASPTLTISKSAPSSVVSGQSLTYTITYGNTGSGNAGGVIISDTLPSGTSFVSATGGGVVNAGAVTWNIGSLSAGVTGQTVSFTVTVTAASGTLTNATYSIQATSVSPVAGAAVMTTVSAPNQPNLTPFQPVGWSDKIVVARTTGTKTDSSPLSTTDALYVSAAVANAGTAPTAARFTSELSVDGTVRTSWSSDPPVNAGGYVYLEDYPIGPLSAGAHTIRVRADSTNAITEGSESDNEYVKTITVTGPPAEAVIATVAVVVSSPGAFSSLFKTGFQMENSTAVPQSGRLVFHPQGTSGTLADPSLSFSLAPGQTLSYDDLLPAMGLTGALVGSLDIVRAGGTPAPVIAARIFNDAGAAGTTGFTIGAIAPEGFLAAGDHGVLLAPADVSKFRMNIGVRTGANGAVLTVTRRTAAGVVVQTLTKNYAPNFFEQIGASAFLEGAAYGNNDSITIQMGAGTAIVYSAIADNITQDPSVRVALKAP